MAEDGAPAWHSYDPIADVYENAAVPWFAPLARDLVERVCEPHATRVLDVGAGTGIVARFVREMLGDRTLVVGLDPARQMLLRSPAAVGMRSINGAAPMFPFRARTFDVVTANLALSHVPDLTETITEVRRVVGPGGRFGFTAWASDATSSDGDERRAAARIVDEVAASWGIEGSSDASPAPWEAMLRDTEVVRDLLATSFDEVAIEERTYRQVLPVASQVSSWWGTGRYRRFVLGQERFAELEREMLLRLTADFGDTVHSVDNFWIVTARA